MNVAVDNVGVTSHELGGCLTILRENGRRELGILNGNGTDLLTLAGNSLSERMHCSSSNASVGEDRIFPLKKSGGMSNGFEPQSFLGKTPDHRDAGGCEAETFIESSGADIVRRNP